MGIIEVVGILIFAIIFSVWYFAFYHKVDKKKKIENARKYDIWLKEQGFEGLSDDDILSGNIPADKIPMKIGDKVFSGVNDEKFKEALSNELFKSEEESSD